MKRIWKILLTMMCVIVMLTNTAFVAFAHSGRTDSSGGHHDNKNKSGLGSYHYHCGGYPAHLHENGYCPYTDVLPSSVTMSAEKTSLRYGETSSIKASVSPSNACYPYVSWETSDSNVVTVSDGNIKAVGYGTATITASSFNGKTASVKITVKEIVAESIKIEKSNENIYVGEMCHLSAIITPEDVDNTSITWLSSDTTVAAVDEEGNVKGLAPGTTEISAETSNGKRDVLTLTVNEVVAEKVEILADETIIHGDHMQAEAKIYPENTTDQNITWEVSDSNIVTMDQNGNIEAHNVGKVTITVVQKDVSASYEIEVLPRKVEKINIISGIEGKMKQGETASLSAEVTPVNATYPQVFWKSSDPDVINIDEEGNIEAKSMGKAVITAYTLDECIETYEIEVQMSDAGVAMILGGAAAVGVGGTMTVRKMKKRSKG